MNDFVLPSETNWFQRYQHMDSSTLRLFCFTYAGGSARVFQGWEKYLPDNIDLFALQAPGRDERIEEKPISCTYHLANIICQQMLPYLNCPFVFLGHSNGALVCFEVARQLRRLGLPIPRHFILSGSRAAQLPKPNRICDLPEPELVAELSQFDGTPQALLENQKFLKMILPLLRADFAIADDYLYHSEPPLDSSASLFWANEETEVSKSETLAWKKQFSGKVDYYEFKGRHLFINEQRAEYLKKCNSILQDTLKYQD